MKTLSDLTLRTTLCQKSTESSGGTQVSRNPVIVFSPVSPLGTSSEVGVGVTELLYKVTGAEQFSSPNLANNLKYGAPHIL